MHVLASSTYHTLALPRGPQEVCRDEAVLASCKCLCVQVSGLLTSKLQKNPILDTSIAAAVPHSQVSWAQEMWAQVGWAQVGHISVLQCFRKSVVLWLQHSGRSDKSGPCGTFT